MGRTISSREDVEVDEWTYQSRCPVCGPDSETAVAGAVRPIVYLCRDCDASWTRETFKRIGDGRGAR